MDDTKPTLSSYQRRKLALECLASERTVKRAYADPDHTREATRMRIARAAVVLGYPEPPHPKDGPSDPERFHELA